YLSKVVRIPLDVALATTALGTVLGISMVPLTGALSDRVGRKPPQLAAAVGLLVLCYPLLADGTWRAGRLHPGAVRLLGATGGADRPGVHAAGRAVHGAGAVHGPVSGLQRGAGGLRRWHTPAGDLVDPADRRPPVARLRPDGRRRAEPRSAAGGARN